MEYKVNDTKLVASAFIFLANQIWRGDYDMKHTQTALSRTMNITAYDNKLFVGCLRILTDGYFFWYDYRIACSSRVSKTRDR